MMCKLLWFALSITSFTAPAAQQKDERPVYSQRPLQVDLIAPLDVGKLSPGSPIFAKARVEWNTATCHMRAGATVSGHTVEVVRHSKTSKGSSLTVLFDTADCDGHATQIPFNLFAVVAAFRAQQDILLSDYGVFGAASTAPHVGGGGKIDPHAAVQMDRNQDFAVTAAGKPVDLPAVIQSRQVFFQRNLFLGVGTGLDGGSTLSSPHGKFRIETGSQFVLMPKLVLSSEAVAAIASAKPSLTSAESARYPETKSVSAPLSPPKSEIDETDICSASCTVASLSDASLGSAKAESTISSDSLGYVPHENGEFSALNHEAALVYLSADNLLFTFDLHKLRHRYPDGVRTETMRTVRAVLIDPASHAVKRVSDWEVQGTGQYIWPISQGSVLVHRGHSLYLMNSNLDPIRSVEVPGQLVFVSLSPDGGRLAVGVLHERHTPDMHNQIANALRMEPEEDVDIYLYDENFKLLLISYQSTAVAPPVLSDDGQIFIVPMGHHRWRITDRGWNQTDRVVATVQSTCRPNVTVRLPQAIFLVGCNSSPLQNWYRMLRTDGNPVVIGRGSSNEI